MNESYGSVQAGVGPGLHTPKRRRKRMVVVVVVCLSIAAVIAIGISVVINHGSHPKAASGQAAIQNEDPPRPPQYEVDSKLAQSMIEDNQTSTWWAAGTDHPIANLQPLKTGSWADVKGVEQYRCTLPVNNNDLIVLGRSSDDRVFVEYVVPSSLPHAPLDEASGPCLGEMDFVLTRDQLHILREEDKK